MSNKIYDITLPVSALKDNADAASLTPWDTNTGNESDPNEPIPGDHAFNIWVSAPSSEAIDKLIERLSLQSHQYLVKFHETDLPSSLSYEDGVDFAINSEGQCIDFEAISALDKPSTKAIISLAGTSLQSSDPLTSTETQKTSEPTL